MPVTWLPDAPEGETRSFAGAVLAYPVYHAQAFNADWEYVYARVWDHTNGQTRDLKVGAGGYDNWVRYADVQVDATPETIAAAEQFERECKARWYARAAVYADWRNLTTIVPGSTVRVYKGRKVPIGTVLHVARIGNGTYGPYLYADGQYINPDNVKLQLPADSVRNMQRRAETCGAGDLALYTVAAFEVIEAE